MTGNRHAEFGKRLMEKGLEVPRQLPTSREGGGEETGEVRSRGSSACEEPQGQRRTSDHPRLPATRYLVRRKWAAFYPRPPRQHPARDPERRALILRRGWDGLAAWPGRCRTAP